MGIHTIGAPEFPRLVAFALTSVEALVCTEPRAAIRGVTAEIFTKAPAPALAASRNE